MEQEVEEDLQVEGKAAEASNKIHKEAVAVDKVVLAVQHEAEAD